MKGRKVSLFVENNDLNIMAYQRLEEECSDALLTEEEDSFGRGQYRKDPEPISAQQHSKRSIIVEPILVLYFIAWLSGITLQGQFVYASFAKKYNLSSYAYAHISNGSSASSDTSCTTDDHNSTYFQVQQRAQVDAAQFSIILDVTSATLQLFAVVVYGALSDKLGRRIPLILPLLGGILKSFVFVLVIKLDLPLLLLLAGSLTESALGGSSTLLMAAFAYIADTTTPKNRTLKITTAEIACGVANAVAQVTLGFTVKYVGYLYPFFFLFGVNLINSIYVFFFVPEPRPKQGSIDARAIFSVHKHIWAAARVYIVNDKNGRRGSMLLSICALFLFGLVLTGRLGPQTLYLLNSPFCWTSVSLGIYMAIFSVCTNSGQIGSYVLFHKKIGDVGIAVLGAVSCVLSLVLLGFAKKSWMIYLVPVVGYGTMLPIPMLRSTMSKLTSPDEQGALFASISGMEIFTSLVGSLMFNPIYEATLSWMSGFVFLVMAGLEFMGLIILMLYILRRVRLRRREFGPALVIT